MENLTQEHNAGLDDAFSEPSIAQAVRETAKSAYAAAEQFWTAAMVAPNLTARLKELVLLALHASSSSLNETGIARHVRRAREAGASEDDIIDVLLSIVGQANHALYFGVPVLAEELAKLGGPEAEIPDLRADLAETKANFLRTRGFWHKDRDLLARLMPEYLTALSAVSVEPWKSGSLTPHERELIYIAIDSSVSHMYEAGLRMHIRNALKEGASRAEIVDVMHLVSLMGLEGYILGTSALMKTRGRE
jgi:alkylhydroperoxidase/carboxymuconolactone decarboxylase family protein YurZ